MLGEELNKHGGRNSELVSRCLKPSLLSVMTSHGECQAVIKLLECCMYGSRTDTSWINSGCYQIPAIIMSLMPIYTNTSSVPCLHWRKGPLVFWCFPSAHPWCVLVWLIPSKMFSFLLHISFHLPRLCLPSIWCPSKSNWRVLAVSVVI